MSKDIKIMQEDVLANDNKMFSLQLDESTDVKWVSTIAGTGVFDS